MKGKDFTVSLARTEQRCKEGQYCQILSERTQESLLPTVIIHDGEEKQTSLQDYNENEWLLNSRPVIIYGKKCYQYDGLLW